MLAPQKESIFGCSCRLWLLSWRRARIFARSCSLLSKYLPISWKQRKEQSHAQCHVTHRIRIFDKISEHVKVAKSVDIAVPELAVTETPFNPIDGPIDGHRNFFRWASMDHRWPSMGFELSPSAWGQLWSIFGLNISNFNLLSFLFEPEQAFSSLKITYIGALSLNFLKKLKNLAKLQLFA